MRHKPLAQLKQTLAVRRSVKAARWMRPAIRPSIALLAIHALIAWSGASGQESPPTGKVVLHAVDADTRKPIPGVEFCKSNSLGEDWFAALGSTDREGRLSFRSKPIPGYYFSVWRAPPGYKVASIDDVASGVVPGGTVEHQFALRKLPAQESFPRIEVVPTDGVRRVPAPMQLERNVHLESIVEDMPGFPNRRIKFWFLPSSKGRATPAQLRLAERIFHNGPRIHAAVKDELTYFQQAETEDRGRIEDMKEILIEIDRPSQNWIFWCRLPRGLPLKQHGYRICFDGLNSWDLQIPDYLQPGF